MCLICEYYKKVGKAPSFDEFLPDVLFDIPPAEAVKNLKEKGKIMFPSTNWNEFDAATHRKAFTVAKVMSAEILQLIYDEVSDAQTKGTTLKDFRNSLYDKLTAAGFTGRTKGQLDVILDTNTKMAHAENQYKQQKLVADKYPYWQYIQQDKKNKRLSHAQYDGKVFHHEDPIWATIYPPSAFRCGCYVEALSKRELDAMGLQVENGADYAKQLKKNKNDFNISPLKSWKPDTNRYVSGIKNRLEKMLKASVGNSSPLDYFKNFKPSTGKELMDNLKKVGLPEDKRPDAHLALTKYFKNRTIEQVLSCFVPKGLRGNIDYSQTKVITDGDKVTIKIKGENGSFRITRKFDFGKKVVEHDFYALHRSLQGKGQVKDCFVTQISLYKELGLENIYIHANIDVGCYAWAKYGFDLRGGDNYYKQFTQKVIEETNLSNDDSKFLRENKLPVSDIVTGGYKDKEGNKIDMKKIFIEKGIDWFGHYDLTNEQLLNKTLRYCGVLP
jgi:SPP1 gp7 family putative phage head morphogenesis protein